MERVLFAQDARSLTDWNGRSLHKDALNELIPGSIVRCVIANETPNRQASEAVYFEIVKYKDGTFWGTTLDIYRIDHDYIGLPVGTIFTFRKSHIMEIPISWQPSSVRRRLKKYLII
jgi:hypothetical protein